MTTTRASNQRMSMQTLPVSLPPRWSAAFQRQVVAVAVSGMDEAGVMRIRLDFLSKPRNRAIHRARERLVLKAPDVSQQLIAIDDGIRTLSEVPQNFELPSGQIEGTAAVLRCVAREIDRGPAESQTLDIGPNPA